MTKDEALKLALDAFQAIPEDIEGYLPDICTDAVTAIKAALAQQDAESHLQAVSDFGQLQEREPVAVTGGGKTYQDVEFLPNAPQLENGTLLYTSPPQRTWVGLTDEELNYLCHLAYTGDEEFALTVQTKLKEKNT